LADSLTQNQPTKPTEFDLVLTTKEPTCELHDLQPDTVYYVRVNAENELGVGYDGEPFIVMTTSHVKGHSLYVWGENSNA
jgi:hypothetical protein